LLQLTERSPMKPMGGLVIMAEESLTGTSHILKAADDGNVVLLYRHAPLTANVVGAFLKSLISAIGRDDAHIDLIDAALRDAGIAPKTAIRRCVTVQQERRDELVAILADLLFERLRDDARLHRVLAAVLMDVLQHTTAPPPRQHCTPAELRALDACCSYAEGSPHIENYDVYAALHAHAITCPVCCIDQLANTAAPDASE
jgi:hypothetical protein